MRSDVKKGVTYCMSRYLADIADSQKLNPAAKRNVKVNVTNMNMRANENATCSKAIIMNNITAEIPKSNIPAKQKLIGKISRGK